MKKHKSISTPQFKTELIRKLKSIAPECEVEFIDELEQGIGFRLKDCQVRYRTNIVRIYRYREPVLTRSDLVGRIVSSGVSEAGFPHGLIT